VEGGIPAVLIYEDIENLTPYMHTADDIQGVSLNAPELLQANARLAAASVVVLAGLSPSEFIRGDANADGSVDIGDAVSLLGFLFGGGSGPDCRKAGDANDDGRIDLSDAVMILRSLFTEGALLPQPHPSCGIDETSDELTCSFYAPCR